jgi:hypothetical protein
MADVGLQHVVERLWQEEAEYLLSGPRGLAVDLLLRFGQFAFVS